MIARYGPWLRVDRCCTDACAPSVRVLSPRPTRGGRRYYRQSVCSVDHRVVAEGVIHRRSSTLRSNSSRSVQVHQYETIWDGSTRETALISGLLFIRDLLKLTQTRSSRLTKTTTPAMRSTTSCLTAISVLVQLVPSASAHGYVNLIKTGGRFYPGWDLLDYYQSKPPAVAGWSTTALDSGFVRPHPPPSQSNTLCSTPTNKTHPGLPRQLPIPRHNLPQIRRPRQNPHPRRRGANRATLLEHLALRPQRPRNRLPRSLRQQQLLHSRQNRSEIRQNRPARPEERTLAGDLGHRRSGSQQQLVDHHDSELAESGRVCAEA
jgi:hypothetical protein